MPNRDLSPVNHDFSSPQAAQQTGENRRSSGRGNRQKQRRKDGDTYETAHKDSSLAEGTSNLTTETSILSHLGDNSFASQTDLRSNLDPSLESYSDSVFNASAQATKALTAEWTQSVPLGRSPPSSHAAAGSPPDSLRFQGGFNRTSPPASPRHIYRTRDHGYQSFGGFVGASPPNVKDLHSEYHNMPNPPLPHHTQAHFYKAPELPIGDPSGPLAFSPGYSCQILDRLSSTDVSSTPRDTLLVGDNTSLRVYDVRQKNVEEIGHKKALRGFVVDAKILEASPVDDAGILRETLIALIIHGRCVAADEGSKRKLQGEAGSTNEFDVTVPPNQALHMARANTYQTTVELYKLNDGAHLMTLFASPEIEGGGHMHKGTKREPSPWGGLSLHGSGRYIVISSSVSGEVLIYERVLDTADPSAIRIDCIGKTWTSVTSRQVRSSSMSSASSGREHEEEENTAPDHVVLSLQSRWLAVVPPPASSSTTLHGQVMSSLDRKFPGFAAHTAPEQPVITCEVDSPRTESIMNRITRDATQELVKGARWVGSQGSQIWNKYWTKASDTTNENQSSLGVQSGTSPPAPQFPPTHAQESSSTRLRTGLSLVSIFDLETLAQSQQLKEGVALTPLATFALPNGCSALSFAPSGTQLFTASGRGDMQQVWDLMRIVHGAEWRSENVEPIFAPPMVREIAFFSRMTEARIIEVAWMEPNGERLALLTDNGTVHIYDLPSAALYWPPLRRSRRVARTTAQPESSGDPQTEGSLQGSPAGLLSSALGGLSARAPPLLSSVRGRTLGFGNSFSGLGGFASTAGAGAKGGKAVAAGLNRSLTAAASGTVNTLRHLGENRIRLPRSVEGRQRGTIKWLHSNRDALLAVTAADTVRLHAIHRSRSANRKRRGSAVDHRPTEIRIPLGFSQAGPPPESSLQLPASGWLNMRRRPPSRGVQPDRHPLSFAEIETHAPYQPFHTDRRVAFHSYRPSAGLAKRDQEAGEEAADMFGEEIAATRLSSVAPSAHDDIASLDDESKATVESIVRKEGSETDGQQILITSRRRRPRKKRTAEDEDEGEEFFEDDLEVVDFAHDRV